MRNKERVIEVASYATIYGDDKAADEYKIKIETVQRYRRQHRKLLEEIDGVEPVDPKLQRTLDELATKYSKEELQLFLKNAHYKPRKPTVDSIQLPDSTIRFAVISDTHIGSNYFREDWFLQSLPVINKKDINFVLHVGDLVEGMSNRPGHVYECSHIGYTDQRDEAVRLLGQIERPMYCVSGNHDLWFVKSSGAYIVEDIAKEIGATFLGNHIGSLEVNGIKILLHHGEDGSSYAHSYRVQKIVEAMDDSEKPDILLVGHTHKAFYTVDRGVQAISSGCFQERTNWMKAKKLAAHPGFWIIEAEITKGAVTRFVPEFFPFRR